MESLHQTASTALPERDGTVEPMPEPADRIYQLVTVAAILLVLGSLWIF
jgi:hypothetical protein